MSYEKLTEFILYLRWMQENDLDVLSITSSPKGFGKSSFAIQASRKYIDLFGLCCPSCKHEWIYDGNAIYSGDYGRIKIKKNLVQPCPKCGSNHVTKPKKFNFMLYLAYDNDEVRDKIFDLPPFSPLIPDEGARFMMGEDWMVTENKEMKKLFAQMRTKHLLLFANIPKFKWMDGKYRNDMATFWIRIMKRGLCLLLQPDLGESDDPWHMKEFEKLLGSYFYFTREDTLIKRADTLKNKHPCVFDYFKVPKVPEDIYKEYRKARDAKVFARKQKEQSLDQKEISKIVVHNLMNKWDQIKGAIKSGRFGRPTLKILEDFVYVNPVTEEPIVRYTTLRNWLKEIEKHVRKGK